MKRQTLRRLINAHKAALYRTFGVAHPLFAFSMTETNTQLESGLLAGVFEFCTKASRSRDLEQIRALLTDPPFDVAALAAGAEFSPDRYTRKAIFMDDAVSVLLLGWLPGQATEIHDHGGGGSACCFRVLQGIAVESRYEPDANGDAVEVARDRFLPGSVLGCDGTDIHAIVNELAEGGGGEPLVTLHVYRPAPVMRNYRLALGAACGVDS